jgi:hypothetical protein
VSSLGAALLFAHPALRGSDRDFAIEVPDLASRLVALQGYQADAASIAA